MSLTEETRALFDAKTFALMNTHAVLINTSRGPVVDTEALHTALQNRQIAYAALDVTDPEPLPPDHKLLDLPNLIVLPHIASATVTSRTKMAMMAVQNMIAGLNGEALPNPVTKPLSR